MYIRIAVCSEFVLCVSVLCVSVVVVVMFVLLTYIGEYILFIVMGNGAKHKMGIKLLPSLGGVGDTWYKMPSAGWT